MNDNDFLSVIIPSYNQERTIAQTIQRVEDAVSRLSVKYEIIVVVDGIIDRTFTYAKRVASSKTRIVGYKYNYGKGYALRYGFARSKGNIIAFIDGGTEISPVGIEMLYAHFKWYKADIIVGSKWHSVSIITYPWWRKLISKVYGLLVKLLFGIKIRDTQLGLKMFKREVLEKVLPRMLVKEFAIDIELLAVSNYLGFKRIYEAPVELNFNNLESTISKNFIKTIWSIFWDTMAVFYRLKIIHYYSDSHKRTWRYDPDLNFKVNIG